MDAHQLGQPSLFESYLEEAEATPKRVGTFLTGQNRSMRVWAALASESIREAVQAAVGGGGESYGGDYEKELCGRLVEKNDRATASVRAALAKQPHLNLPGELVQLTHIPVPERNAAVDLVVRWEWSDGTVWDMPVNVKTGTGGVSLTSLVRLATDPTWNVFRPGKNRGVDTELWLLELIADRRHILPGRDYFMLKVETTGKGKSRRYVGHELHGLLSQLDRSGKKLAIGRNTRRMDVTLRKPGELLPPTYDVNVGLAEALLPWSPRVKLDTQVGLYCDLVEAGDLKTPAQRSAYAALLLDTPRAEVTRAAGRGVASLAPD